nr:pilus assembly protein [Neisseria sp. HSC-16F19]
MPPLKLKQQGFSLFIVLIVMLVIAFLVIAGTQSVNTEMRMSSNDADRKYALSLAESALRTGENRIAALPANTAFSVACTDGLCVPAGGVTVPMGSERFTIAATERVGSCTAAGCNTIAWERTIGAPNTDNILNSGTKSVQVNTADAAKKPRYIIEYLNKDNQGRYFFRVTARAWGKNDNTVVTLQSYVEATFP